VTRRSKKRATKQADDEIVKGIMKGDKAVLAKLMTLPTTPKYEATDADMERVATFLQEHPMSSLEKISDTLELKQVTVAISLMQLSRKGIVGKVLGKPIFFLK
jgi:hypothetical protein